jgi:dienelactone hydrolase
MFALMLAALMCGAPCTSAPDSAIIWRYDLRTGDHLVYRELFRQEIDGSAVYGTPGKHDKPFGSPFVSAARYEWSSHVLVVRADGDRILVGVQRDRARDDSIVTSLDTMSTLTASDRARLQSRLRGRERYAQANLLTASGDARLPWAARREMRSKMLWDLFELPSLPAAAVRLGDHWQSTDPFTFDMHVAATDTLGGENCYRAEGTATAELLIPRSNADSSALHLKMWYCPASHLVRRIELEGTYPDVNYYKVHETAVLELGAHTRGEASTDWLKRSELRQGVLSAVAAGDSSAVASLLSTPGLDTILAGADTASARLLLGVRYRAGASAAPMSVAALSMPLASDNPRTRTLAVRMLARVDPAVARPLLERAAADSDYFVREAASRLLHPDSTRRNAGIAACTLPDSMRALLARPRPSRAVGTHFRGMSSDSLRSWPYAAYIPDDYRGDEPFPLIIYLAGNSGPAIEGVQLASNAFERTGYIVIYPNSWGGWWRSATETMVDSLLKEVTRKYTIDPDRVYISGLSNGGTGTLDYASLWPQRFSAAVVAMGAGLFGFTEPGGDRPFASNVAHLPMLFLHGKLDQVIPFSATTKTVDSLRAQHADVAMTLFPQREHEIVPGTGDDGATVNFFEHHVGRTIPKKIDFAVATTAHARSYWVEILEKEEIPGSDANLPDAIRARLGTLVRSGVRASIDERNTIKLDAQHVRRVRLLLRPDLFAQPGNVKIVLNGKTMFEGPLPTDCALYARTLADTGDPYLAYSAELTFDVPK